jgi:hypothetical protein
MALMVQQAVERGSTGTPIWRAQPFPGLSRIERTSLKGRANAFENRLNRGRYFEAARVGSKLFVRQFCGSRRRVWSSLGSVGRVLKILGRATQGCTISTNCWRLRFVVCCAVGKARRASLRQLWLPDAHEKWKGNSAINIRVNATNSPLVAG